LAVRNLAFEHLRAAFFIEFQDIVDGHADRKTAAMIPPVLVPEM
jgi:hypothetical protein